MQDNDKDTNHKCFLVVREELWVKLVGDHTVSPVPTIVTIPTSDAQCLKNRGEGDILC